MLLHLSVQRKLLQSRLSTHLHKRLWRHSIKYSMVLLLHSTVQPAHSHPSRSGKCACMFHLARS
jgi:hypothetical protein